MKLTNTEILALIEKAVQRKRAIVNECRDSQNPQVKEMVIRADECMQTLLAVHDAMKGVNYNLRVLANGLLE